VAIRKDFEFDQFETLDGLKQAIFIDQELQDAEIIPKSIDSWEKIGLSLQHSGEILPDMSFSAFLQLLKDTWTDNALFVKEIPR
jgi:hypothetical protein